MQTCWCHESRLKVCAFYTFDLCTLHSVQAWDRGTKTIFEIKIWIIFQIRGRDYLDNKYSPNNRHSYQYLLAQCNLLFYIWFEYCNSHTFTCWWLTILHTERGNVFCGLAILWSQPCSKQTKCIAQFTIPNDTTSTRIAHMFYIFTFLSSKRRHSVLYNKTYGKRHFL